MKKYQLSVIILIYNQELFSILLTLESCLRQKNVRMQIVLSDDASQKPCLEECAAYMEKRGFTDYKLIHHDKNVGTVVNFYDALQGAEGIYVKSFGPGDCFSGDQVAEEWLEHIENAKCQLSFCDINYYYKKKQEYILIQEVAHPQFLRIYLKNRKLQKRYYILYNDIFAAVSIIGKKDIFLKYTEQIKGKVKYAEDNMFRLMAFDGISCIYFPQKAIYYEWGVGVSTGENSMFYKALKQDWDVTSELISKRCGASLIDRLIQSAYKTEDSVLSLGDKLLRYVVNMDLFYRGKRGKRLTSIRDVKYLYVLSEAVDL